MRIITPENLFDELDRDLAWRKKELTFIVNSLKLSGSSDIELYYLRIGITFLYAHWEGYIKNSSYYYLNYIKNKRLKQGDLSINLLTLCLNNQINKCSLAKKVSIRSNLVNAIISDHSILASVPDKKSIKTESNLKYEILSEILFTLGLDGTYFELKRNLIDSSLLKIRNKVAHGNYIPLVKKDFLESYKEVLGMIEKFKELITLAVESNNHIRVAE